MTATTLLVTGVGAEAQIPSPFGTTVFTTAKLCILVTVSLVNLLVLIFVLVLVMVVVPRTLLHTVVGGGCEALDMVVVVKIVDVSVLVANTVPREVDVTIVIYDAGVFAQRGTSNSMIGALLRTERGERWNFGFGVAVLVGPGIQDSVVVTVVMTFLLIVRAMGVEVTVRVVVVFPPVMVRIPVVHREVTVEAGRVLTSISVAVCVVAGIY